MTILGIETATSICAVAVVRDRSVIAEKTLDVPHMHSEKLMLFIDECLKSAGITLANLDGIAVSIGPGSFTGLRIGLSVAKGLAYAGDKPLAAVSTLEALASKTISRLMRKGNETIVAMIDARRDEVYVAVYTCSATKLIERVPSRALDLAAVEQLVRDFEKIIIIGDGAEKFHQHLVKTNSPLLSRTILPAREEHACSAAAVALLGEQTLGEGRTSDVAFLEPLYGKEFHTIVQTQHPRVNS